MIDRDKSWGSMSLVPIQSRLKVFCWCLDVIDYFTGKSWSFPLRTKAEAYGAAKALILKMENADRPPEGIEIYQSDHGGEMIMSTELRAFLDERGIFWRTAPRRTPNYNGVVERHIQSKNNMMRTFIQQSGLPDDKWNHARQAATFTMDRVPRS